MTTLPTLIAEIEKEMEDNFNRKFGFGTWDSRAKDGHRNEGTSSTSVLEFQRAFLTSSILRVLKEAREKTVKSITQP